MQEQPRYTLIRRILFPYSGEEPLTRMQGLRVILTWGLLFSFSMTLCTMMTIAMVGPFSRQRTVLLLLIAFLSGAAVFGMLGWVVVSMSNRAARIFQQHAAKTNSTNGGRYGS